VGGVRGFCQRRKGRLLISKSVVLVVPGRLDTLTGGYGYDRRIVAGLAARGWTVTVRELHDSFPFPTPEARAEARSVLASIGDGALVLLDGLAFGVLPDEAEREAGRLRLVALVHHPLAAEAGLSVADANALEADERRALATVQRVVVTSRRTAAALAPYGVGQDRISVVEPGTDPAPLAVGSTGGPLHLLCVASLVPRKGHDVLFRALASIPCRGWRLTCVGSLDRPGAMAERLRTLARTLGLEDHITLAGEADGARLETHYASADVFVLPTLYEGYGMVVAEALAHGLPVVSTHTGAIAELVGDQAGILVSPGDVKALANALSQVLVNDNDGDAVRVRERLARGARQVRDTLPTWDEAVRKMDDVLSRGSG
jgi:glycosyltransferase involved in cell wall biosynthesis